MLFTYYDSVMIHVINSCTFYPIWYVVIARGKQESFIIASYSQRSMGKFEVIHLREAKERGRCILLGFRWDEEGVSAGTDGFPTEGHHGLFGSE